MSTIENRSVSESHNHDRMDDYRHSFLPREGSQVFMRCLPPHSPSFRPDFPASLRHLLMTTNATTANKKRLLETIASELGVKLKVETPVKD